MSKYAENEKVLPVLAPIDIVATATNTAYVDMKYNTGLVEFEINFGVVTSTDSTGGICVTVEASTSQASSDSGTAIAFNYRLSAAVATDTMGDITAATSAGATVLSSALDNCSLLLFVDPSVIQAVDTARYVRAVITPTTEETVTLVGGVCRFTPRFAGNSQPSST